MAPDYSSQLNAIALALSQPSTPAWKISLLSASVGLLVGLIAQPFVLLIKERFELRRMRLVLYHELAELFSKVDWVMSFRELAGSDLYRWQEGQLSELMSFSGEASLKQKPELYLQLSERFGADMCYRYFHRVLDEKNSLHENTHLALAAFAGALHERSLKPGRLRRFLGKDKANRLNRRAREINEMQTAIRHRMKSPNESSNEGES